MQNLYDYLEECDNVVIASPLYFTELTGSLLNVGSRLQTYFSAHYFRKEEPLLSKKKGVVIITGGGNGDCNNAYKTAKCLFKNMNVQDIFPLIFCGNTDFKPAKENKNVLKDIRRAAEFLSNP